MTTSIFVYIEKVKRIGKTNWFMRLNLTLNKVSIGHELHILVIISINLFNHIQRYNFLMEKEKRNWTVINSSETLAILIIHVCNNRCTLPKAIMKNLLARKHIVKETWKAAFIKLNSQQIDYRDIALIYKSQYKSDCLLFIFKIPAICWSKIFFTLAAQASAGMFSTSH